ncbi:pilus assembly protein TadG-related protein [Variovorax sp. 770b2]|uniref:pilus assembly protein TadG-related protein n=1 Tax=Variovorax sp. 770b2 TaxID=1566271 RepID=UPI0008F0AD49|nr:TadG family pilus assembly protein [Variovorax sp. 770b2]SFP98791.1 Putative Tad-like Flp pilus-assembly [Variovorax sp. 770b2]
MDTAPRNSLRRAAGHAPGARGRRARGSIVINTAIALSLVVITLLGTQIGYLMLMKRELQKTADLAALSGAQSLLPLSCVDARTAAVANAAQNMPPMLPPLAAADVECGNWDPQTREAPQYFGAPNAGQAFNAVRVRLSRTPALLLPNLSGGLPYTITVQALAAQRSPLAVLSIRSTLLTVDSARSTLLNSVIGGMLGGSLAVGVVGWQGMVDTNLKLLTFLDQLGIELGLGVGKYDQVLGTDVSVGVLIKAMIKALEQGGNTASAAIQALGLIQLAAEVSPTVVKLGDVLGVQTGSNAAGLNVDLQVFQLLQGVVQVANGKNALVASVPLTVPGVLNITTNVRVIEPPQVSAIGNPALAKLNPTGPDQIYVRTAQIRTLISVELPVLSGISNLLNAVTTLVSPVTTLLNDILGFKLNILGDVLACLIGCTKDVTDVDILPAPTRLDINLDAGGGESRVTDFSCPSDAKTLTTQTTTSAAKLRIGKMGTSAEDAKTKVFSSSAVPVVDPVPVIDIGSMKCTRLLLGLIPVACDEAHRKAFYGGGLGLKANVPVAESSAPQTFSNPPDLADPETPTPYLSVSSANIVNSLSATAGGLNLLIPIAATGSANGGLQNVLTALTNVLGTVIGVLQGVISNVLTPLLGTLVDSLLSDVLGANLAQTEVGARLTCAGGAELVY